MTLPYVGYLSFALGALTGSLIGLIDGLVHTQLKIPSFIATLAAMGVWSGLSLVITNIRLIQIELKMPTISHLHGSPGNFWVSRTRR